MESVPEVVAAAATLRSYVQSGGDRQSHLSVGEKEKGGTEDRAKGSNWGGQKMVLQPGNPISKEGIQGSFRDK